MTWTHAGLYADSLAARLGGPYVGSVLVLVAGTATPAVLYSNRTKTTTVPNPTSTDGLGNVEFYAEPGQYDLKTPLATAPFITVPVAPDPADLGGAAAVTSVFGRTGNVAAQGGDYSVGQVTGAAPAASPTLTGTVTVSGRAVVTPDDLGSSGASVAIDASTGNHFRILANTASWTLANPINATDGQRIVVEVTQDGTGNRVVSFGTAFNFGSTIGTPVLSTGAGKRDYLGFVYNGPAGRWDCWAYSLGF